MGIRSGMRAIWRALTGRAPSRDDEALPNPDGTLLAAEIETLQGILAEIDEIAGSLPEDAQPIGVAARSLVEASLDECRKPRVNARRVAEDMAKVSALAAAMRERLLLAPQPRQSLKN
jgi:hypothetical protein